jgi:hypothetical protein
VVHAHRTRVTVGMPAAEGPVVAVRTAAGTGEEVSQAAARRRGEVMLAVVMGAAWPAPAAVASGIAPFRPAGGVPGCRLDASPHLVRASREV